jgi:hypothetical protein
MYCPENAILGLHVTICCRFGAFKTLSFPIFVRGQNEWRQKNADVNSPKYGFEFKRISLEFYEFPMEIMMPPTTIKAPPIRLIPINL